MVTYEDDTMRRKFAARLNRCLDARDFPDKFHGRQTRLAEALGGVSQKGVRKWLEGESIPGTRNMARLAAFLGISVAELQHGDENIVRDGPDMRGRVPLISWVHAGQPREVVDPFEPGMADDWVPCPQSHGPRTFALRVEGNSMTQDRDPSYPHRSLIFCDPDQIGGDLTGRRVIASIPGQEARTFKELDMENGVPILRPLNPQHETIRGEFEVVALVLGRYIPD